MVIDILTSKEKQPFQSIYIYIVILIIYIYIYIYLPKIHRRGPANSNTVMQHYNAKKQIYFDIRQLRGCMLL